MSQKATPDYEKLQAIQDRLTQLVGAINRTASGAEGAEIERLIQIWRQEERRLKGLLGIEKEPC